MNKDKQPLLLGICSYCGEYTSPETSQITRTDDGVLVVCTDCQRFHRIQTITRNIGAFFAGKRRKYATSVR